jgi:hypothetical protein
MPGIAITAIYSSIENLVFQAKSDTNGSATADIHSAK